jgi:hypothetical protein
MIVFFLWKATRSGEGTRHAERRSDVTKQIALALAGMLLVESAAFGREVVRADWGAFRKQVETRRLMGRSARIVLTSGDRVGTTILSIDDTALEVRSTRSTKSWNSGNERARIPQDQVRSVRFNGRLGSKGRLIGGLAGLGGGAAIGVAVGYGASGDSGPQQILAPAAGVATLVFGFVAGYFIGRTADKLAPEFVIER